MTARVAGVEVSTEHLPKKLAAAKAKYAEYLEHEVGNL